jgi:hypothetical protein
VAACAAPLEAALLLPLPRHRVRRGKKSYSGEIFPPMVYFLRLFQVWVIFI